MGFPRAMVLQAMQASGNNPDVAVAILTGELPFVNNGGGGSGGGGGGDFGEQGNYEDEFYNDFEGDEVDLGGYAGGGGGSGGGSGGGGGGGGQRGIFDDLKNTPQFQQLRILARQNPAMLEQVLSQLPRQVVEAISQNQEEFIRVLQEDPIVPNQGQGQGQQPVQPNLNRQQPQMQQPVQGQGQGQGQGQQIRVQVTVEDQAAIENLMEMTGCDKNKVMQAYFLFEKDVEVAANYLLNHGFEDDGQ